MKIFGFELPFTTDKKAPTKPKSFVAPESEEGELVIDSAGAYGTYFDIAGSFKNDAELISKYREMLLQPEVDSAVEDIVNEAIVVEENKQPISLNLDNLKVGEGVKKKIKEEFDNLCILLNFKKQAYDIFRHWYVDGRLFYHVVIDEKDPNKGIIELRYIDPRLIQKIVETEKEIDPKTNVEMISIVDKYYVYTPGTDALGYRNREVAQIPKEGIKIAEDSIIYAHSGKINKNNNTVLSHLHKCIKPYNQLRMMEDAMVIYRIARAPERRIFYIDTSSMPTTKANEYVRKIMAGYKNKLTYDSNSGEITDDRRHFALLEDFWIPRHNGSNTTEIDTLPAGQNLGELDDVEYFQKKLMRSMNVPLSRLMEPDNGFNMGRASEINRDELKFFKFIEKLRHRFSDLFDQLLEKQLILKNVISSKEEWKKMKPYIDYEYVSDSVFTESKSAEIMKDRLDLLSQIEPYVGTFYSKEFVFDKILRLSEEEIKTMKKQMEEDRKEDEETPEVNEPLFVTPADEMPFGSSESDSNDTESTKNINTDTSKQDESDKQEEE